MQFRDSLLQGLTEHRQLRNIRTHVTVTAAFVVLLASLYYIGQGFLLRLWQPPPFFYRVGYHEILLAAYSGLVVYATIALGIHSGLIVSLLGLLIAIPHHIFFPAQPDAYYRIASWLAKNCLLVVFIGAALNAKERQGRYLREVFSAEEQVRLRLARELHDDVAQRLIDAGHAIDELLVPTAAPPTDSKERLRMLRRQVDEVSEGTRRVIQGLRPPLLEEIGLRRSLAWLCQELSEEANIKVEHHIDIDAAAMTPEVEFAIYRISQEAISNVKKHAAATRMEYTLQATPRKIRLTVSDNGRGFAPPGQGKLRSAGKMGLVGIQERVRLLRGTLDVISAPGRGTTLRIGIPQGD